MASLFTPESACAPAASSPVCRRYQPRPAQRSCVTLVRWTPPRHGWAKLNFDGSVYKDGSGRASIRGVIRDHNGRILLAFAERTEHATIGVVEARALIRGLQLALDHGWNRLLVEGDDLTLVRLLRCGSNHTRIPTAMLDDILWLLDSFCLCEVQHAYREGNQVADKLCHEVYKMPQMARVWTAGTGLVPFPVWERSLKTTGAAWFTRESVREMRLAPTSKTGVEQLWSLHG